MWVASLENEELKTIKVQLEEGEKIQRVAFQWGVTEGDYDALVTRIIEEVGASETLLKLQKNIRELLNYTEADDESEIMDYDIYSEREQAKQEPIPYQYVEIPHRLHEQILYVVEDITSLASVWDIYCRKTGMPSEINQTDLAKSIVRNIMEKNDLKSTFDIIEIAFQFAEKQGISKDTLKAKTDEINNYFRKSSFGYQLKEKRMVRIANYPIDNRTYTFYGVSGKRYEYYLPRDIDMIPTETGNYMFAAWRNNEWQVLYVGESENLQNRLVNNQHEKMTDVTVFAHPDSVRILYDANKWNENERRKAKRDIINSLSPPLNFQDTIQNDKNTQQKVKQKQNSKTEDYDDRDESKHNSDWESTHKVIRTKLNAVQKVTPLAETVEWNSSNQKIRITPAPVNNTALWKNVLERLHDEISDIKSNDRLSNTHAALMPVIENLKLRLEQYENSPQRIHDEIDMALSDVKWLEDKGEIANDLHTQRLKRVFTDCALDIRGNVLGVQEVVEKRNKLRSIQLSEDEQGLLASVTEKVLHYIEEEQVKQDMQQDVEAFKENQNATDTQKKTFKSYRWASRLSRILDLLMEKAQNFWKSVKPVVISKTIEIIISKVLGLLD